MPETAYDQNDPEKVSKFAGEEFGVGNVRTVFAGASKGYHSFMSLHKSQFVI